MRKTTDYIFVHCSATKPDHDIGVEDIRRWHKQLGWKDIGYNFVIDRTGNKQGGRDLDNDGDYMEEIGAHVRGYNSRSIGICLVGGVDYAGNPDFNFTLKQMKTLEILLGQLEAEYPNAQILGHRDVDSGKACPCFNVNEWWYG